MAVLVSGVIQVPDVELLAITLPSRRERTVGGGFPKDNTARPQSPMTYNSRYAITPFSVSTGLCKRTDNI